MFKEIIGFISHLLEFQALPTSKRLCFLKMCSSLFNDALEIQNILPSTAGPSSYMSFEMETSRVH